MHRATENTNDYTRLDNHNQARGNNPYAIQIVDQRNYAVGQLTAYYRGTSSIFHIYQDTPIRRAADNEIITATYQKYPLTKLAGLMALLGSIGAISSSIISGDEDSDEDSHKLSIVPFIGTAIAAALLLRWAQKATARNEQEAILILQTQVRNEINSRESATRGTGGLHAQGAIQEISYQQGPSAV